MDKNSLAESLIAEALALGAFRANVIQTSEVVTDRSFREACKQNICGLYGKCWTCPPDIGDIDELIAQLGHYKYTLLFQTVGNLDDSFDIENMLLHKKAHIALSRAVRNRVKALGLSDFLLLSGGGCGVCDVCAKKTGEPCRFPEEAVASLEAYGIFVAKTAEKADMKYINGKDTVTYFSAVFFN